MSAIQSAVFPAIGQGYSTPLTGAAYTGATRHYLSIGATGVVIVTGSKTWNSSAAYELSVKVYSTDFTNSQVFIGQQSNTTRLSYDNLPSAVEWRVASGTFAITAGMVTVNTNYHHVITDAAGDGTIDIKCTNLDNGAVEIEENFVAGTSSADRTGTMTFGTGNSSVSPLRGYLWDVKWSEAGVLLHHWKFDEGGGLTAYDSHGTQDATITMGTSNWVDAVEL